MAASMDNALRAGAPRSSLKFTIFGQVMVIFFLLLSNTLLLAADGWFNMVQNAVYSIRTFSIVYGVLQCGLYGFIFTREMDSEPVAHRSTSKVPIITRIASILKCTLLFVCSCLALHIVIVLFGAAVQEVVEETSVLAILLSTLSTLPCLLILGSNGEAWNRFAAQRRPQPGLETCVLYAAVASLFGAWLGAFTIPLDWDRPWQVWPIPCAAGAILGHTGGLVAGLLHLILLASKQHTRGKNKHY